MSRLPLILAATLSLAACGPEPKAPEAPPAAPAASSTAAAPAPAPAAAVAVPPALQAIVDAADRSEDDRKLDKNRHPGETLAFFGVAPGQKVAELMAGGGYTAELLARAVGPSGAVYGQNTKTILERFAEKPWSARLGKPVMKSVVRVDRDLEDPLPPEAKNLDGIFMVLFYHDAIWLKVDRDKMNRAIFQALKPGGFFAVIDHSGRPGTGSTETQTLHRIEEKVLREEIERAGFKLAAEASFLRNPSDTRDWNDSPREAGDRRGTSDRFVLKFVKP